MATVGEVQIAVGMNESVVRMQARLCIESCSSSRRFSYNKPSDTNSPAVENTFLDTISNNNV
jgi:hypothetical protein